MRYNLTCPLYPPVGAGGRIYYSYLAELGVGKTAIAGELLDSFSEGARGGFYLKQALFESKDRGHLAAAEAAKDRFESGPFVEQLYVHLGEAAIAALVFRVERERTNTINQSRLPIINEWLREWKASVAPASVRPI